MNAFLILMPLLPMAAAPAACWLASGDKRRGYAVMAGSILIVLVCAACLLLAAFQGREASLSLPLWMGFGFTMRADAFRALYALVISFMWLLTALLSPEYFAHGHGHGSYLLFTLVTLGASVGVFLSDDLYTAFVFFEVMSLSSYPWVAHEGDGEAMRASATYLAIAVFGGMAALMGLIMLKNILGTLAFSELPLAAGTLSDKGALLAPALLILTGFGAKAGMFPLHVWLPKAHPVAPAPASALLSGALTKIGVFGVLVLTARVLIHDALWGQILLALGTVTMLLGALMGLLSVNLKRTLACSSMSQIGFILVGTAMQALLGHENALAAQGTVLHMLNHSLIKLTLFMAAGVIVMKTHQLDLNILRGYGRKKPLLAACFLTGAASISGIPFFSGYVSKTLLHESLLEFIHLAHVGHSPAGMVPVVETLFTITGGLTFAYMLKLFIALFVEKNADQAAQKRFDGAGRGMNPLSAASLSLSALVLLILGLMPDLFMTPLANLSLPFLLASPPAHAVDYFAWINLKGALISLSIGLAVYVGVVRRCLMRGDEAGVRHYVNLLPPWLDLENSVYRPAVSFLTDAGTMLARGLNAAAELRWLRPVLSGFAGMASAASRLAADARSFLRRSHAAARAFAEAAKKRARSIAASPPPDRKDADKPPSA